MEVYTQDDFIVAVVANCLQDDEVDDASEGFFEFVRGIRTDEEKYRLLERAERLLKHDPVLPTPEKLKELSEIFLDLPRDGWEMLERQSNPH